jgi:predicted metalloprotease with PDZ domain
MIHYKLYLKNPSSHYIYVDLTIDANILLQLWNYNYRLGDPGRYELGNFAKNVKRVDVFDENDKPLVYQKSTKDCWVIETNGAKKMKVTYSYHTTEINAGNCYADDTQLYVNPVHLCMYVPNRVKKNIPLS